MKVVAADIARALGISKATVSLALNGKPGVKESTRKEILEYKEKMESGLISKEEPQYVENGFVKSQRIPSRQIKILFIDNGMKNTPGAELDLWTDVKMVFEKMLRAEGYSLGLAYTNFQSDEAASVLAECEADTIDGIIVMGTELKSEDKPFIESIKKPLVVYDCCVISGRYPSVTIDNRQGIELAVNALWNKGKRDIIYLGNPMPMYNYLSRRRGFSDSLMLRGVYSPEEIKSKIIDTDSSIDGVYYFMKDYLKSHQLPQAFIMDSYHVSIGTVRALLEKGIHIPEDISLIGVDQLPSYMTGGLQLTSIRVPHTERAYWTVQLLLKEIRNPVKEKAKLYVDCVLEEGDTI
jgi:LacI family transcriptional regulator